MRRFLLQVVAAALSVVALAGQAPRPRPPEVHGAGTVTILTDSITDPSSRAARAVNELAERRGDLGDIRVLPIAGHGAAANVRDLLHLRGVDLAILNSDIFEYLNQTRQYQDAGGRIRYVTHLFDQKVYLLARKEFGSFESLRGRKLAVLSKGGASHTTAVTLFRLAKVDVATLEQFGPDAILDDAAMSKLDGAMVLSDELSRVRLSADARKALRVLPIPATPALRRSYKPAVIEAHELAGFSEAGKTETVSVATLLAVYYWTPQKGDRYAKVTAFMQGFFAALPGLRQKSSMEAFWRQADVNATIFGWTRHPAASPERILSKAQLAGLAAVDRTYAILPPAVPTLPPPAARPKIKVAAVGRAPLADEHLSDGGLITALVQGSLAVAQPAGPAGPSEMELVWAKSGLPQIRSLLSDASVTLSWPWEGADCERPNDLVHASALLCDAALYSDPILQVVVGLFTLSDSPFRFEKDESIFGKTVCVPQDQDVSVLNGEGRNWLSEKRVIAVRPPTLLDCVSAVQKREADAFVANDLEGRYVLQRLGLAPHFKMAERPLGTRSIHAIALRENTQASDLIQAVNKGLRQLKQTDAYAAVVRGHLMRLWDIKSNAP
jgi:TRAP-type uncharacterized transport system substrate-binding protein